MSKRFDKLENIEQAQLGHKITNGEEILKQIDKHYNNGKPPGLEYILVQPYSYIRLPFGFVFHINSYGHSALRYTLPDGKQKVMNINGKHQRGPMVQFYSPEEYFFTKASEQKGIFNRSMIGIRVNNVDSSKIEELDKYFEDVKARSCECNATFDIITGPIFNTMRKIFPVMAERGNCARWTSAGLEKIGMVTSRSMFPKTIFVDMFENCDKTNIGGYDNVTVVSYEVIEHADQDYGVKQKNSDAGLAPLQFFRSIFYSDLKNSAHCTVDVPYPDYDARLTRHNPDNIFKPNPYRNFWINNNLSIAVSTIASIFLIRRYTGRILDRFRQRGFYGRNQEK